MKPFRVSLLAIGAVVLLVLGLSAQPGGEKDKGKKGPPPFELGKVLPPFVRDELELTEEQQKQIADLENEVRMKLQKILTKDQQKRIQEMSGKGPKGPPDGKGKDKGPKGPPDGKEKDDLPKRPPMEEGTPTANLFKNPVFAVAGANDKVPQHYTLQGDVEWTHTGGKFEFGHRGIAFHSGKDLDGDGKCSGAVSQDVTGFTPGRGKWFRFSFRGLAQNNFTVEGDGLFMKVDFFGKNGALDGVTRQLYPQIEKDRLELAVNGKFGRGGGAVWKTYQHDFMLPFAEIDRLRLSVAFRNGAAKTEQEANFYLSEFSLTPLPDPMQRTRAAQGPKGKTVAPAELVPLGGRWYYLPEKPGDRTKPSSLTIEHRNADRLFYLDHQLGNPFAENMSAWLLKGYKDRQGNVVAQDRFVADNIVIRFEDDRTMMIQTKNLPNHPTAMFPAIRGSGDKNPNYIQEQAQTFYLPLNPERNPNALAMDKTNSNRALPMGPIGIAVNGVVFYNPFDAGIQDAVDFMDRCCGHPSPDNRYHYHKYPVCVKSPFLDEGNEHSPLIGFAFDGFPIYGPYESKGLMAKDARDNSLNEFNVHHDDVHGWHYHVTPGRYPYIIGGYWGTADARNIMFKKGKKK
jgi:YHYH protein